MEGFQDDRTNGERSSSDEDEVNEHSHQVNTNSQDYPSQTSSPTDKPHLVNGHSSKTYHNGFYGYSEPVVRKDISSRDYFEDSDSYPQLVTSGEGEPDIGGEAEFCDSNNEERREGSYDVTPTQKGEGDEGGFHTNMTEDNMEGGDVNHLKTDARGDYNGKPVLSDNASFSRQSYPWHNIDRESFSRNQKTTVHSHSDEASAGTDENAKDVHDSIVLSSQTHEKNKHDGGENGAMSKLDSNCKSLDTNESDNVAQEINMDRNTRKDDELMIAISGSGRISLVPTDECKVTTTLLHKGSYVGPTEQKKSPDTGFNDQKKRFEALRQKFNEPAGTFKNNSDSDSELDHQENAENSLSTHRHAEYVEVPANDKCIDSHSREEPSSVKGNECITSLL